MHQPTSYDTGPVVLLLDSSGAPVDDVVGSPDDPPDDPLVGPLESLPSLLAPVLEVDGSVEMLTDVSGSVVSGSSPVDVLPEGSAVPPSSPQPSTVANAQVDKTQDIIHLEAPTITARERSTTPSFINRH